MGLIFKQTFQNIILTYIGIFFGVINMWFLYPLFLKDTYYGLVAYIVANANVLMPLLVFGVHNSLIKFYGSFSDEKQRGGFLLIMFFLPIVVSIPLTVFGIIFYEQLVSYISSTSHIVESYVWLIGVLALSYAYFEVFFAWAKTHLRSVYGNFLKEIFHRIFVTFFLILVYFDYITPQIFVYALIATFILRTFLMFISAIYVRRPKITWATPNNIKHIFRYNSLMVLVGFMGSMLLSMDNTYIGIYVSIEDVAYYSVAFFIAGIIAIPNKAMHQIVYPITANLLNEKNYESLEKLYKKTALNLYAFSSIIFLLIIINIDEIYKLAPSDKYAENASIVFILACARLIDNIIGNNNAIIFSSDYFKLIFRLVIFMTILTLGILYIFVNIWGVFGVAIAMMMVYFIYHGLKIFFVYKFFKIHPFSRGIYHITLWLIGFGLVFYFWSFHFSVVVNIILKSSLLLISTFIYMCYFPFSEEIKDFIHRIKSTIIKF